MSPSPPVSPRISVVIPCFNDGSFLVEAIESIRETEPVNVIVVDDASTDPTTCEVVLQLAALPSLSVVCHAVNSGAAEAINDGVRHCTTPYAFILGADDLVEAGALALMADELDRDQGVGAVWGCYTLFGARAGTLQVPPLDPWQLTCVNRWPGVAMVRVRDYNAVGGLDSSVLFEDWDLWLSFAESGISGASLQGVPYFRYRIHDGASRRHSRGTIEFAREYRRLRSRHPVLFARRQEMKSRSALSRHTKLREELGLWLLLVTPGRWRWTHAAAGDAARRATTWMRRGYWGDTPT